MLTEIFRPLANSSLRHPAVPTIRLPARYSFPTKSTSGDPPVQKQWAEKERRKNGQSQQQMFPVCLGPLPWAPKSAGLAISSDGCAIGCQQKLPLPWARHNPCATSIFGDFARGWQRAATAPVDREALRRSFLKSPLRLGHSCCPKRVRVAARCSPPYPRGLNTTWAMTSSVSPCSGACVCPCPPARECRCGGELDILGDHRAACATAGVLVRRAVPVERVVARICRGAGGRVATDVFLRELNLGLPITDARRLEVVANGLPSFHGAQVAVDVTLVCPIQRDGCPRPGADTEPGQALGAQRSHLPRIRAARTLQAGSPCARGGRPLEHSDPKVSSCFGTWESACFALPLPRCTGPCLATPLGPDVDRCGQHCL